MLPVIFYVVGIVSASFIVVWSALHTYFKFRGKRLVTCPETREPAAVEVDARHAALTAPTGELSLRLKDCNRWSEREYCGQECLAQIASAPEDCLVRTILTSWCGGKKCVVCGKAFGEINRLDHKPALMTPERVTKEWSEIPTETIPKVLATHWPVCWDCYIAEKFRLRYPQLVVDRPWRPGESHRTS